jgi:very-short-patch-repair endonuclease
MKSKIKLFGSEEEKIYQLLSQCNNNNQICYHLKNNPDLIDYLKNITNLNKEPMELLYHFKENLKEVPLCICGKERKYHCYGYRPTCSSKKCQNIVREKSKKKYCLEKYGIEFVTQLDSMKEKSKKTCLKKYGVDNSLKSPEIVKKRSERNIEKYGVSDPIALKSIRGNDADRGLEKIQSTLPDGYKVLESDKHYYYKLMCPKKHIFDIGKSSIYLKKKNNIEICNQCNEYIGSKGEQDVYEYVASIYSGKIIRNTRKLIPPYEIDILIPDLNIAIEFNGDYWHSEKVKDEHYHLIKLNKCLSKGYKLLQIRENDWNNNQSDIKRKLYNIINDIYDKKDINIIDNIIIFDLSWYDDRIIFGLEDFLIENINPSLVKVGQYYQWDTGHSIYKI